MTSRAMLQRQCLKHCSLRHAMRTWSKLVATFLESLEILLQETQGQGMIFSCYKAEADCLSFAFQGLGGNGNGYDTQLFPVLNTNF